MGHVLYTEKQLQVTIQFCVFKIILPVNGSSTSPSKPSDILERSIKNELYN